MIGALLGQAAAWIFGQIPGAPALHPSLCALICMGGVGASIIGSPLAMIFLVLETSGDFEAAVIVAIGAVTSSFLTDRLFGYSFATWRFQQRGLAVESGHDIARLDSTSIAGLVRPPKRALALNARLDEVVRAVSAAGAKGTAVFTPGAAFVGLVDPALIETIEAEPELPVVAADLVYSTVPMVTPQTTLAEILDIFRNSDRPTLAVLDPTNSRKLIGCVRARDAFALASSILDAQRREDLGVGS
jgi:CIC family chloride channel protein